MLVALPAPIFNVTFSGCQAVFAFDNASNHCSYAADALRVENMNSILEVNKACCGRPSCMHGKGLSQSMSFAQDYYNRELAGKPKGIMRVLKERGLWPERGLVLECPTTQLTRLQPRGWLLCSPNSWGREGLSGSERAPEGRGWSTGPLCSVLSQVSLSATDAEQNGLQGKIVDDFKAFKATVPEALASLTDAPIRGFYQLAVRTIDAYCAGLLYDGRVWAQYVDHTDR